MFNKKNFILLSIIIAWFSQPTQGSLHIKKTQANSLLPKMILFPEKIKPNVVAHLCNELSTMQAYAKLNIQLLLSLPYDKQAALVASKQYLLKNFTYYNNSFLHKAFPQKKPDPDRIF